MPEFLSAFAKKKSSRYKMSRYICPHCRKPIDDDEALLCLYCGESLERPVGTLGKIRYSTHWTLLAAVIGFVLLAFVLLVAVASAHAKRADLSGSWYTSDPVSLKKELNAYLRDVKLPRIDGKVIGLMSPHAGYRFSGPVAAYSYKIIERMSPGTIVIVGFTHRLHRKGKIAILAEDAFVTPLGSAVLDSSLNKRLLDYSSNISYIKDAFSGENSVEMMVPFAQVASPESKLVLIAICDQDYKTSKLMADALYDALKDTKDFVLLASTDCSHYLKYGQANKLDNHTIKYIKANDPDKFYAESLKNRHELMCGPGAVYAVMAASKKFGANTAKILKYANSGDTSGMKEKVVGYLSAAFIKSDKAGAEETAGLQEGEMFTEDQKHILLKIARDTIRHYLETGKRLDVSVEDPVLKEDMGAFVTLHKKGRLRGCIGNMVARGPLYLAVRDMAIAAALEDPRFRPLTLDELDDVDIEISALSPMEKIDDHDLIEMGKHGVLIRKGFRSGVYLPQVATETGWDREEFMNSLCEHKAGLPADAWKKGGADIYVFTAEVFGEKEHE